MPEPSAFSPPSITHKATGEIRRVGFELEFTGLPLDQAARVLKNTLGGDLRQKSAAEAVLQCDPLGEFTIEIDWNYLKDLAAENQAGEGSDWFDLLSQSTSLLVPIEIVCPPLPIDQMERLDPVISGLRRAGAVGTEDSMIAAFGVHINTEIPSLDAPTLFAYLRAFGLLQWWLVDNPRVDFTRKLSPYIALYPEAYVKQLCLSANPTLEQLTSDYLSFNASRNRALDLLPLLAEVDQQRIADAVGDRRVQARPAFHYRLPDCHIEKPEWSLAQPWKSWWFVEELAGQTEALNELCERFLTLDRPLLGVSRSEWTELIDRWLNDCASA